MRTRLNGMPWLAEWVSRMSCSTTSWKASVCALMLCWACSAKSQPKTTAGEQPNTSGIPNRAHTLAASVTGRGVSEGKDPREPPRDNQPHAAAHSGDDVASVLALDGSASTSFGGPSSGKVRGAIALPDRGPGFYHNPRRPDQARFGTVELVQAIVRAAAVVDRELPGSALTVNDLGLAQGGPIAQHASHQAGRDADILFYALDEHGAPIPAVGVPLDPQGKGWDFKDLAVPNDDQAVQLDAPRTWRFVAALLELTGDAVQRIFIVEHVRSLLLKEAKRVHAPKALVQRFEDVTCQPGAPHDDHLHVRMFCTPQDIAEGCLDGVPLYPWREQELAALGIKPALAPNPSREDRNAVKKRTTSPEQARKKAGPMHAKVKQFLLERNAWIKRPRPGRPYCK